MIKVGHIENDSFECVFKTRDDARRWINKQKDSVMFYMEEIGEIVMEKSDTTLAIEKQRDIEKKVSLLVSYQEKLDVIRQICLHELNAFTDELTPFDDAQKKECDKIWDNMAYGFKQVNTAICDLMRQLEKTI